MPLPALPLTAVFDDLPDPRRETANKLHGPTNILAIAPCAVSGIYAGRQCSKCHERPGEMLGAFSYRLALEDPPAKGGGLGAGFPFQP